MKLSVALCTYNGEKFLREQLDSILNQTLKIDEIVICDDKSTDTTIEIINEYVEKFSSIFQIYINEITLKSVKNFEKALNLCTGEIVFLSDQDDVWKTNKVEEYVAYFNRNKTIKAIASNGYCIDENSKVIEKYSLWDIPFFLKEHNTNIDYFKTITYFSNIATGASMAVKKELLSEIIPFPILKNLHHDEWIASIASATNAFVLLNEKYFYYRIHNNQQVGGVFFDKTEEEKRNITNVFNLNNDNITFHNFKIKIKKIVDSYKKNKALSMLNEKHSKLFQENSTKIELYYLSTLKSMQKQYPVKSFFIQVSDKLTHKRQLK